MNAKFLPTLALCASAFVLAAEVQPAGKSEEAAQAAATSWLAMVDGGQYAGSWQNAATYFKGAVTEAQWKQSIEAVRKPLGALVLRKLKSAKQAKSLPGAPDGEYVVLQFDTVFENKKEAVETVTPMLEKDGNWKVSGYFIK
jgi:hypothetical protein